MKQKSKTKTNIIEFLKEKRKGGEMCTSEDAERLDIIQIGGLIDAYDYLYVAERFDISKLLFAQPCPFAKGRIHPHVTRFYWNDGKITSVFHVKPIYYWTMDMQWKPLGDVTYGFGNHWIDFKPDYKNRVHPRYLQWLKKRLELLHKNSMPLKSVRMVVKDEWGNTKEILYQALK